MPAKNLIGKISDALDIAKTGTALASNIDKCSDPDNKDKTGSIVGIIGNGLLLGSKIGNVIIEDHIESNFKLQIKSSLSRLSGYVDRSNPFFTDTYNIFQNIERDSFNHIMSDYGRQIKAEYPNDTRVQAFWNFVIGVSKGVMFESEFNYCISKIRELDCKIIRNNNAHLNPQYVEQTLVPNYLSFADGVFRGLNNELRILGIIV